MYIVKVQCVCYNDNEKQSGRCGMDIKKIVSEMTLEEKCTFASGLDAWHTPRIERLGVKSIMMCDGPQYVDRRNWPESKIYEIINRANELLDDIK